MKILVSLDGLEASFNAFRSACTIARKTGSHVIAFHVNKGMEYSPEETGWTSIKERIASELDTFGHEVIGKAYEIGKTLGVPVEGYIARGVPADEIIKYISDHGIIKLLVMGHSSKGRGAQEFVESTTKNVIVQSRLPVLVTSSDIHIRRVLVAIDGSDISHKVVSFGGNFAKLLGADLGLIAFVPDTEAKLAEYRLIAEVPNLERHIESSEKKLYEMMERAMRSALETLSSMDIAASSTIKKGQYDGVISEAKNYDLLITGVQNITSQKKLSSTDNKLLNHHALNMIVVQ